MRDFVPLSDGVKAVKEVLFALEHAHSRGIAHRDVKPANIMLAHVAKLSDFQYSAGYRGRSATFRKTRLRRTIGIIFMRL